MFPAANWGDIIPPYTYVDRDGDTKTFPGYNWSPQGQAIWELGCSPPPKPLTPLVECVEAGSGDGFLAHFGYENPNPEITVPFENVFDPLSANGLQPTRFEPGRVEDAFQVPSRGEPLTWHLTGKTVTATANSNGCKGSITIIKVLNPKSDPGRFNLEIDGVTAGGAASVGDGGNTGTVAVSAGQHTVGESAAGSTDLSDYDVQITCSSGSGVARSGTGPKLSVTVRNRQAIACVITNTNKVAKPIQPMLECVVFQSGVPSAAVWGYSNPNSFPVTIPIGTTNGFAPGPLDRKQPQVFQPGRLVGAFQTPFAGASLVWTVGTKTATASSSSTRCTATLELRKESVPANDPGFFNLQVNGQTWAVGGNGTTTGPVTIGVGEGTVSETAGPGTDLANYDSTVACTRNGIVVVSTTGTKVDGAVAQGDVVVCTFTNTRKPNAPPQGPTQPQPPQPPLPPPAAPAPPLGDLSVVKTAAPATAVLGQTIRWQVTVTNHSTLAAAEVDVARISELTYRVKVIAIRPSQGTCSIGGCNLGRIEPGASVTITILAKASHTGRVLNAVRVSSEEQESNYLNNTAAALVRITEPIEEAAASAVKGAAFTRACSTVVAEPRSLQVGRTSIVLATARNRYGKPLRSLTVHALGLGINEQAKTDSRGIARFALTPRQPGLVYFQHGVRLPAGVRSRCRTLLGVLGATATKPVTG